MSDGQLRARYHALKREETWAPRHVDDDLAAAHQHAARSRTDAAVWAARAKSPGRDDDQIETLRDASENASADAADAQQVSRELGEVDEARSHWFAETAVTRDNAHRAGAELRARGVDPEAPDRVTADEWIEAHRAEQAETDRHREITEDYELSDHPTNQRAADVEEADDVAEQVAETDVPGIRELSAPQADERADTSTRAGIPTLDETAEDVARAQVALQEIEQRRRYEQTVEADHADDLAAWDADDRADGTGHDDADTDGDVDVLHR
ncbi:hypothetical protein [Pseudonocardia endophytica]|uniref:hypothetical protein n=1 Tax=Pseudonocardia endophytica TaxID=401976 RepID=UPI0010438647|nr:hypothetical protein [Pseudonocardia endophytica]